MSLSNPNKTHPSKVADRRAAYQKKIPNKSLTVQADKARCCVNNIMAKFRKTGLVDHIRKHQGRYGDFSNGLEFQDAMNKVASAQQSFDLLPSEIRKRFDNNPAEFLQFVSQPENEAEMIRLGLATPRPDPTPEPSTGPENTAEAPAEA